MSLTPEDRARIRRAIDRRRRQACDDPRIEAPTWADLSRTEDENRRLRRRLATAERLLAEGPRQHRNQYGSFAVYASEEERLEARRMTWRLSKQRAALRAAG